jgi:hypothetical protein
MLKRIRIICIITALLCTISACSKNKIISSNTTELNKTGSNTDIATTTNASPELTGPNQNISNEEVESITTTETDLKRIYTDKSMTFVWVDNNLKSIQDNILYYYQKYMKDKYKLITVDLNKFKKKTY